MNIIVKPYRDPEVVFQKNRKIIVRYSITANIRKMTVKIMKTLDEVIELNTRILRFAFLPDDDITTTAGLANYYLKEYRQSYSFIQHAISDLTIQKERLGMYEANNPLTWNELKDMTAKPVFIEEYEPIYDNKVWIRSRWMLIEFINEESFYARDEAGEQYFYEKGKDTWKAYRKERL